MQGLLFQAVIFDLDGVITQTAKLHAQAWKVAFDEYLHLRSQRINEPFVEFAQDKDYLTYLDGKPRYQGVESFLLSRGINLPFGEPDDSSEKETVCGVGNLKNVKFLEILKNQGAQVYRSTVDFVKKLRDAGVRVGVASSSKNCKYILESVGIADLFETRVDGLVSAQVGLKGKPEPDIFTLAAKNLGVDITKTVVVEDANSGVQAGRNGGFGLVIGVARENNDKDLLLNGADFVVKDLQEVTLELCQKWFQRMPQECFSVWDKKQGLKERIFSKKKIVFFLDYDGTLTPIVSRPQLAVLNADMRETIKKIVDKGHNVSIVSGRMREDVEQLVGVKGIFYAGSHGMDIKGPSFSLVCEQAQATVSEISQVIDQAKKELADIKGIVIEEKHFSVALHYRLVEEEEGIFKIKTFVKKIVSKNKKLRLMEGKKVFEVLPNIEWNKGQAIRWLMQSLNLSWQDSSVVYIGDDLTDEYAFSCVRTRGAGILVASQVRPSAAEFYLSSPEGVMELFEKVIKDS